MEMKDVRSVDGQDLRGLFARNPDNVNVGVDDGNVVLNSEVIFVIEEFIQTEQIIPPDVGKWLDLTQISICSNNLIGGLSPELSKLTRLTKLELSGNKLSGTLPEFLFQSLPNLGVLNLRGNNISGSIPPCIEGALNLTSLDLSSNKLSGVIPIQLFKNLVKITKLNLSRNKDLGGEIPHELRFLRDLEDLDLSGTAVEGTIPEEIGLLTKLKILNLHATKLSGEIPDSVENLNELTDVHIEDTAISGLDWLWLDDHDVGEILKAATKFAKKIGIHRAPKYPLFLLANLPLLANFPSSVVVLNKRFGEISEFFKILLTEQNPHVLLCMIRLWISVTMAASRHNTEEKELMKKAETIRDMILAVFDCDTMDDPLNVLRLLLPSAVVTCHFENTQKHFKPERNVYYLMRAHSFLDGELLALCLKYSFKPIFATSQVSHIMSSLFTGNLLRCTRLLPFGTHQESWESETRNINLLSVSPIQFPTFHKKENKYLQPKVKLRIRLYEFLKTTYQLWWNPRSCPAIRFLSEGASKAVLLVLVTLVLSEYNGIQQHSQMLSAQISWTGFVLIVMTGTSVLYEIGQLEDNMWSLFRHFDDTWNRLDAVSTGLLCVWALSLKAATVNNEISQALVSLAAVPLTLGQLQFMSVSKSLGRLVIAIQRMMLDLVYFLVVYFICIFGFGIAFFGLFYGAPGFQNGETTFLSGFSAALSNIDYTMFDSPSAFVATVGLCLYLVFVTMTAIVLLNLLIALMSNTYQDIDLKALEEWSFVKAENVQQLLLVREKSPLCMLPPPLNVIPILLYPLQNYCMKKYNVSICGTVANCVYSILGAFPRSLAFTAALSLRHWVRWFRNEKLGKDDLKRQQFSADNRMNMSSRVQRTTSTASVSSVSAKGGLGGREFSSWLIRNCIDEQHQISRSDIWSFLPLVLGSMLLSLLVLVCYPIILLFFIVVAISHFGHDCIAHVKPGNISGFVLDYGIDICDRSVETHDGHGGEDRMTTSRQTLSIVPTRGTMTYDDQDLHTMQDFFIREGNLDFYRAFVEGKDEIKMFEPSDIESILACAFFQSDNEGGALGPITAQSRLGNRENGRETITRTSVASRQTSWDAIKSLSDGECSQEGWSQSPLHLGTRNSGLRTPPPSTRAGMVLTDDLQLQQQQQHNTEKALESLQIDLGFLLQRQKEDLDQVKMRQDALAQELQLIQAAHSKEFSKMQHSLLQMMQLLQGRESP